MRYEFRIFGPNAGQTMAINRHQFVNGIATMVGAPQNMAHAMKVFSYHGVFATGTPEYDAALEREQTSGNGDVSEAAELRDAEAVQPDGHEGPDGLGTSDPEADVEPESVRTEAGEAVVESAGDGHPDAGVRDFAGAADAVKPTEPAGQHNELITAAVHRLDPDNADHWTQAGLPKLAAIEDALGRAGVTRQDVEDAAPGFTREAALEAAAQDL
jgi:hypothetical protein